MGGSATNLHDFPHVADRQRSRRPHGHPHDSLRRCRHLDNGHVCQLLRADHRPTLHNVRASDGPRHITRVYSFHDHPRTLLQAPSWRRQRDRSVWQRRVNYDPAVRAAAPPGDHRTAAHHADHERTTRQSSCVCAHVEAAL